MPETRRDLRRAQIIAAARALVAEGGLEALTIGALESRLDFTRGVITYHFKDKDDIVFAVFESVTREIGAGARAELERLPAGPRRVAATPSAMLRGFLERPEAVRVLFSFWSRLGRDRRARLLNAKLYETYRREAARILGEPPRSPRAALMVGCVLGLASQHFFAPGSIDAEAAARHAGRALARHS